MSVNIIPDMTYNMFGGTLSLLISTDSRFGIISVPICSCVYYVTGMLQTAVVIMITLSSTQAGSLVCE